jgi:hypothetical protein
MEISVNRGCLVFLGVAVSAVLLAALLGVAYLLPGFYLGHHPGDENTESDLYSREDFRDLIMGKSEPEVLDAVGKPDHTSEDSQFEYWHYRRRTRDLTTDKVDSDVQVVFQDGKVIAVNY